MSEQHDSPRSELPVVYIPLAVVIGALIALAWCVGFGVWLATSLIAMR